MGDFRRLATGILALMLAVVVSAWLAGCTFGGSKGGGVAWTNDLPAAIERADTSRKLVLVDFWSSG